MSDLSDLQAAQTVKIAGAGSTGSETNYINATVNGEVRVANIIDTTGTQGALSVSTTAIPIRVGLSNLAGRTVVTALNNGTATIFWGRTSGLTTSNGTQLMRNQMAIWDVGPNSDIYLIATSGSHDVRITEA